jgi:hypothetical protein
LLFGGAETSNILWRYIAILSGLKWLFYIMALYNYGLSDAGGFSGSIITAHYVE